MLNPQTHPQPAPASPGALAPEALLPGDCAAFIGLDWGDQQHSIALCLRGSSRVETLALEHSAESLHAWLDSLRLRFDGAPVAIALESSKGAVVAALLEHPWLLIYPVHPCTSRRFSTAFSPSGAKDDLPDARILLDILRIHRDRLRLLVPHDAGTRRISLLNEARRTMVDRRTRLSNELTSLLKNYFPQAIDLTGEKRYSPLALSFLEHWPELAALQTARPQTVRKFYYAHQVRRPELIEKRLEQIRVARPLTNDRALCDVSIIEQSGLVAELRILEKHIAEIEKELAREFAAHPDSALFKDIPGAGAAMGPRLTALFGADRNRWPSAVELQTYYGIAPVVEKSGKQKWVHWRWNAPVFARQTLVEWAGLSAKYSDWARAYYAQQTRAGKGRGTILRALAFKWLRILWRCWKDNIPYNETQYIARLQTRNPALHALIQSA